jgi:hypothetical protein
VSVWVQRNAALVRQAVGGKKVGRPLWGLIAARRPRPVPSCHPHDKDNLGREILRLKTQLRAGAKPFPPELFHHIPIQNFTSILIETGQMHRDVSNTSHGAQHLRAAHVDTYSPYTTFHRCYPKRTLGRIRSHRTHQKREQRSDSGLLFNSFSLTLQHTQ